MNGILSLLFAAVAGAAAPAPPPTPQGWNPADKDADVTLSGTGNVTATVVSSGTQQGAVRSVTGHSSADATDWYAELTIGGTGGNVIVGIATSSASIAFYPGADANGRGYYGQNGQKQDNGLGTAYGATFTSGDVIGIRFNTSTGTLTFYKNGASQGTAYSGGALSSGTWYLMWGPGTTGAATRACTLNTGQSAFASAPGGVTAWG